ncbi:hypothetical protein E2C01_001493 [Portunus trituberculatus]|uniref:Uncharacterized protein n=1 Tax=Portunus trituberculatus TaxID=210409 RepID=A0A5B7CHB4_PORTR|nr:hypothetical protein [Portunus trituberculatus]
MHQQRVALESQGEAAELKQTPSPVLGEASKFRGKAKNEGATLVREAVAEGAKMLKRREIEEKRKKKVEAQVNENYCICCAVFCGFSSFIVVVVNYLMNSDKSRM